MMRAGTLETRGKENTLHLDQAEQGKNYLEEA
jgi:hypothetical protein